MSVRPRARWPAASPTTASTTTFIKDLGSKIKPNSSALFLLIRKVTADKVLERLRAEGFTGHVLQTSLTNEQEDALRKAIGDASATSAAPATS